MEVGWGENQGKNVQTGKQQEALPAIRSIDREKTLACHGGMRPLLEFDQLKKHF